MSNEPPIPENTAPVAAIVIGTHSTNPEFDGDCDYAVVQLTPELVDQIRRRVELVREAGRQDDDLYEIYFWGGTAEFYDCNLLDTCQEAVAAAKGADSDQAAQDWLTGLEQNGHALMPPATDLAACQPQRTECDQTIVRRCPSAHDPRYEIAWTASPKHTDVYVTTKDLTLAALEGYFRNDPKVLSVTERSLKPCVRVEYDLNYAGGDYNKVGDFAYIPLDAISAIPGRLAGDERLKAAFQIITGYNPIHIVHYTFDEVYDQDGNEWKDDE